MMQNSQATWNRGDLAAFAADYEDSPETTFVGKDVTHGGTAAILARYQAHYPTREAMGTLTYSEIERARAGAGPGAGQREIRATAHRRGRRRRERPVHPRDPQDVQGMEDHSRPFELIGAIIAV